MFKRTEEQEWTRFSKALSNRESRRHSDAESPEGAEEVKSEESIPSPTATPSTPAAPAPPPIQRPVITTLTSQSRESHSQGAGHLLEAATCSPCIGPQTSFSGTLRSETAVRILGAVDGEIISSQSVAIEESAPGEGPCHGGDHHSSWRGQW